MNFEVFIQKAMTKGLSAVEIYHTASEETMISLFNGAVDKAEIKNSNVYSVRGIYKGKMAYVTFENEAEDSDNLIAKLIENAESLTTDEEFEIFAGSKEYPKWETVDGGFSQATMTDKIKLIKDVEHIASNMDKRVTFLPYCGYSEEKVSTRIVNSYGLDIAKNYQYGVLVLQVIAKEEKDTQSGFEIVVTLNYADLDPQKVAKKAVEKALSKLNASPVESKTYPIIIENETMCDLLQGFSSMFSGEAAIKKLTPLIGKEGEKIMGECVSIVDDPFLKDAINRQPFDDEGVVCYKKMVVDKGVFKTMLHNLKTAKYFKTTSTGNGFKAGTAGAISVAGVNLYVAPGSMSKDEMIANTEEGLLITDMTGLNAGLNPISGDFSLQSSGYLIKDGKIVRPINLVVVSGNFLKMMNQIETLGSDLYVSYKGVGAPSIKFKGLPVSGK